MYACMDPACLPTYISTYPSNACPWLCACAYHSTCVEVRGSVFFFYQIGFAIGTKVGIARSFTDSSPKFNFMYCEMSREVNI